MKDSLDILAMEAVRLTERMVEHARDEVEQHRAQIDRLREAAEMRLRAP